MLHMTTITIKHRPGRQGTEKVEATYITGQFAVHRTSTIDPYGPLANLWTVTHIPTGLAITHYCKSEPEAREMADWTKANFGQCGVNARSTDPSHFKNNRLRDLMFPRLESLRLDYEESLPEVDA